VLTQRLIPGIVGISTYVDFVYQKEMQLAAVAAAGSEGPINQLRSVTVTLDFNLLVHNLQADRRSVAEQQVAAACRALQAAGADFVVVTSGTTSTLTALARQQIAIPFLDLAEACWRQGELPAKVGLLSTSYAAAAGGLFAAAAKRHDAELILPAADLAEQVDAVIFDDLIRGDISRTVIRVLGIAIDQLEAAGAAAIILGNTDMTLAAGELATIAAVPLVDAARAHARDAASVALSGGVWWPYFRQQD
jgi:aspartate racemase